MIKMLKEMITTFCAYYKKNRIMYVLVDIVFLLSFGVKIRISNKISAEVI